MIETNTTVSVLKCGGKILSIGFKTGKPCIIESSRTQNLSNMTKYLQQACNQINLQLGTRLYGHLDDERQHCLHGFRLQCHIVAIIHASNGAES